MKYKVKSDQDLIRLQEELGDCAMMRICNDENEELALCDIRFFCSFQPYLFPLIIQPI